MKKILLSAVVLIAFTTATNAQATASAAAYATIVTPISISKATGGDLNFGNIATNGVAGTVIVAPDDTRSLGVVGGLTLPIVTGTVGAASFDVSGTAAYTYAITLPGIVTLTLSAGNTMTVDTWTTDGTTNSTGTLDATTGTDNLNIGGTLHVGTGQLAGTYSNAAFNITVNYN